MYFINILSKWDIIILRRCELYRVFQKELYNFESL